MPVEVIMPKVDMDMATGKLAAWHVAEGEAVSAFVADWALEASVDVVAVPFDPPLSFPIDLATGASSVAGAGLLTVGKLATEAGAATGVTGSTLSHVTVRNGAKAFVGDCGSDLAQNCFQVFGGIGYTWEHDQHLYLRRISTDAAFHGDPSWHREHLCQLAGI